MRSQMLFAAVPVVTMLMLSGCTSEGETMSSETSADEAERLAAIDELMAQPSAEAAQATFDELGDEIRTALDDEFGAFTWDVESSFGSGSVCGGRYDMLEGQAVYVSARAQDQIIDGDDWARAVDVVSDVVAGSGYDDEFVVSDENSSRQIEFYGERDSVVRFYSHTSLGVAIDSGCYLTQVGRDAVEQFGVPDPDYWRLLYPDSTAIPTER